MSRNDISGLEKEHNKIEEKKLPYEGYRKGNELIGNTKKELKRVMVGVPTTGLVRMEWVIGKYGQIIPCNWSQVDSLQWLDQYSPIDFLVADARNICVHNAVSQGFDWLFFNDHDTIMPPGTILAMNNRMRDGKIPIWSGLYFTKSKPSEPLIYRGKGTGFYKDWKLGDEVWVDGLPMGCTMIHTSILKVLSDESESYEVKPGFPIKKVFETPAKVWYDSEERTWYSATGTEDLHFCERVRTNKIFEKAGWPEYEGVEFPFLIDTKIFCRHIDQSGVQYPANGEETEFMEKKEEDKEDEKTT